MNLFQSGHFTLANGDTSTWKIECDALSTDDWNTLAMMLMEVLPPFGAVEGVPSGGLPFAAALAPHVDPTSGQLLIVDDVWTTGGSWERHRANREAIGAVVFARHAPRHGVYPLFCMLLF
jgi:orotate phosphoribosyltransferase